MFIATLSLCLAFAFSACGPDKTGGNDTYYTVTFDSQGGSAAESQRILKGNLARTPSSPTRDDFIFQGWYQSNDEDAQLWNFATDRVNADITLYAFWKVDTSEPTQSITYELNAAKNGYVVTGAGQEAKIVIPESYNDLPVVEIGERAFAYSKHKSDILSVTIPDSVTVIGLNAFHNQDALVSVNIGTNSKLVSIGNNAFSGNGALTSFYLPAGFTSLGNDVFNNCGSLNTFISASAVYSDEGNNLIEVATHTLIRGTNSSKIPASVTEIAPSAFRRASGITELFIPVSVVKIGNYFIADSTIEKLQYEGTEEAWNEIEKGKLWNLGKTEIEIEYSVQSEQEEITEMYITINGNKKEVTLEKNSSVDALVELLKQGDITYTANDYGGFEKVGSLGHTLPSSDTRITTEPGDVILYSSNSIVLFYGNNTWPYTKIGKIKYSNLDELKSFLGAGQGSVQVTISLK